MATKESDQGPYLSAAFFCEKVLVEQDGVKSAIRIIDRVIHQALGPEPPTEMEPFEYELSLFIRFKSGRARGTRTIDVQMVKPSGESRLVTKFPVLFEGEDDRGIDSVGIIRLKFDQTGLYWFNIYLDAIRVTRVPFRVIYMPRQVKAS